MKTYSTLVKIGFFGLIFLTVASCTKETPKTLPSLSTLVVTNITNNSATVVDTVNSDGGDQITARGVCWHPFMTEPTINDSKTTDGTGIGKYISYITGLKPGTKYYIRAYAANSVGTAYSNPSSFRTCDAPILLTNILSYSASSIECGGDIYSDGGAPILSRGVCWSSTNKEPTIVDSRTIAGTGIGKYISTITGLMPGTKYYLRAYASNAYDTGYGSTMSTVTFPLITTQAISSITSVSAVSGGIITSNEIPSYDRGICWNTLRNPTIENNTCYNNQYSSKSFTCSLTGLIPNKIYYVRAFADVNNNGQYIYGNEISFTTQR